MKLSPELARVASMVGRRADDSALLQWVGDDLQKTLPAKTTSASKGKYVVAKKRGLELLFSHEVLHPDYPPIKSGRSFIPYLMVVWVREKFTGNLPLALGHGMNSAALEEVLGPPHDTHPIRGPLWALPIDSDRGILLHVERDFRLAVDVGLALYVPTEPMLELFVLWAKARDLLGDEVDLSRGLWTTHLADQPGLRNRAFAYFRRLRDDWIVDDLNGAFGARKGPSGHDEPDIDRVDASSKAKAFKIFDRRFGEWT